MNALSSVIGSAGWYILNIAELGLLVCSMTLLLRALRKNNRKALILSAMNMVIDFLLFVVLMDCGHMPVVTEPNRFNDFQLTLFQLPFALYEGIAVLSLILLLYSILAGTKIEEKEIGPDAIKQAVDTLPAGISISSRDGAIRLANLRINELCEAITGDLYTNAKSFWEVIAQKGREQGGQYLVQVPGNKVWLFRKELIYVSGERLEQITATDVTEKYDIIEELEAMHEHLQDIRQRMKIVSDLSADMFVAKEKADARAALHNQLGQVLLMGRHYLSHQDTTDPEIVYAATTQMNRFLLGEAKEPYHGDEDVLAQAVAMANSIGVKVDLKGSSLGNEKEYAEIRELLGQAVTECAANTVKHAEGDQLTIWITEDNTNINIVLTNNGRPPKGPITESGGLLSLRRKVEAAGGRMELECNDAFVLRLDFPRPVSDSSAKQ